jgi:poly(3-hydroxybutyrate) depolymerase
MLAANADALKSSRVKSSGCGTPTDLPTGVPTERTVEDRRYLVTLPVGYDPSKAYPVVLSFHGFMESADSLASYDGLIDNAKSGDLIAVHPDGAGDVVEGKAWKSWNAVGSSFASGASEKTCDAEIAKKFPGPCYKSCGRCNPCSWTTCKDDVHFVKRVLDLVEADFCIDLTKVRGQGESNGGMLVYELLQSPLAARFESLVSIVANPGIATLQVPAAPVRFLGLWGRHDATMPFGVPTDTQVQSWDGFYYSSAHNSTRTIAQHYGCSLTPVDVVMKKEAEHVSCQSFPDCKQGEVTQCTFKGKHIWPRYMASLLNGFYHMDTHSSHAKRHLLLRKETRVARKLFLRQQVLQTAPDILH